MSGFGNWSTLRNSPRMTGHTTLVLVLAVVFGRSVVVVVVAEEAKEGHEQE